MPRTDRFQQHLAELAAQSDADMRRLWQSVGMSEATIERAIAVRRNEPIEEKTEKPKRGGGGSRHRAKQ
jgi:hypothetical protein